MANPFVTPQEQQSFSGLVDDVVMETGKVQNLLTIVQYVNLVIRECQTLGLFAKDTVEDILTADASPYFWMRVPNFRSFSAVKYLSSCSYPKYKNPGPQQFNETSYFYASDDYFVFNGVAVADQIGVLMYMWAPRLLYYARLGADTSQFPGGPYNPRKAYFDVEQQKWQYLNGGGTAYIDTTGVAATDAIYRKASSHWLIEDWYQMIANGAKSKVYAQFGDTDRANRAYSMYMNDRTMLRNTVGFAVESGLR